MARYVQQVHYFQGSPIQLQRYFSIITPGNGEISASPRKGWRLAEGRTGNQQQGGSRALPSALLRCWNVLLLIWHNSENGIIPITM